MTEKISLVRQKRQERGLSLRQVAKVTGIPHATLHRIECGIGSTIRREHARALYQFYDYEISLSEIYDPMFDFEGSAA